MSTECTCHSIDGVIPYTCYFNPFPWRVKSYSVRQSKLTKGTVWAGLGEKGLRKRDGQVGPVNPFPPRGSPLTSNNCLVLDRVKLTKWMVLAGLGEKGLMVYIQYIVFQT